ncbi:nuclear transport factor 2 family protein [soil metagenome]
MHEPTPSLAAEIEALREAYAALNRNDVPGFVAIFDPQIERIEEFAQTRTYHGLAAVTAHVLEGRSTWAEGGCEPERFIVSGERIIVLVNINVRLKTETEWREGRTGDVFTFRNGKAVEFHSFADGRRANEWVEAMDAN